MDAVWDALHRAYPGVFKSLFASTERERLKHQAHWLATFREVGLDPTDISAGLKRISKGDRGLDKNGNKLSAEYPPSLPVFIQLARPDQGLLCHASRRPASEVMALQTGAKAHALLPETAERKSRRKTVGNAAMAAMLGDF
jgi:hypothetical protein